jgi:hypothetical protein
MSRTHAFIPIACVSMGLGLAALVSIAEVAATPGQQAASQSVQLVQQARRDRGAPPVVVTHADGQWTLTGARTKVTIGEHDLAIAIQAGGAAWSMVPSTSQDMIVRTRGADRAVRLADAARIVFSPYDTGFKTGVKVALSGWPQTDLTLFLSIALQEDADRDGTNEELVFDVAAREPGTTIRRLEWPTALDAHDVDYTVLNNWRGTLLPRTWPTAYDPIRSDSSYPNDTSEIQSNLVESWSMSWWGFQRGSSAMMVIVETPDDAAYQFRHPAGGPTIIGPRWRASLGRLAYPRTARMCFFESGNYVDLAKRYRRHVMENGLYVPLREKIARSPTVQRLIGTPATRLSILRNLKPDSARYDPKSPEKNYSLTTFDERSRQIREIRASGLERLQVCLTGWPTLGYDRQHPDGLPPAAAAGGWEGMKRFADTVREVGYVLTLHDQYRDYYVDAPSYDREFAIHDEDDVTPSNAFPGSRFGQWKEGPIPFMNRWDGGTQSYLSPLFMLGHLRKNYRLIFDHGIRPDGSYLDVFGYVPPDEDFNPEHPATRTDAIRSRTMCYLWARRNLGIVGTEAAVDWTVPYVDFSSPLGPAKAGIPVPLFGLVYHDAIITPYAPGDLHGFINGGVPQASLDDLRNRLQRVRDMAALHQRVALLEMTKHEFLGPIDAGQRRERTTFADGTTVVVDWAAGTVSVTSGK